MNDRTKLYRAIKKIVGSDYDDMFVKTVCEMVYQSKNTSVDTSLMIECVSDKVRTVLAWMVDNAILHVYEVHNGIYLIDISESMFENLLKGHQNNPSIFDTRIEGVSLITDSNTIEVIDDLTRKLVNNGVENIARDEHIKVLFKMSVNLYTNMGLKHGCSPDVMGACVILNVCIERALRESDIEFTSDLNSIEFVNAFHFLLSNPQYGKLFYNPETKSMVFCTCYCILQSILEMDLLEDEVGKLHYDNETYDNEPYKVIETHAQIEMYANGTLFPNVGHDDLIPDDDMTITEFLESFE